MGVPTCTFCGGSGALTSFCTFAGFHTRVFSLIRDVTRCLRPYWSVSYHSLTARLGGSRFGPYVEIIGTVTRFVIVTAGVAGAGAGVAEVAGAA